MQKVVLTLSALLITAAPAYAQAPPAKAPAAKAVTAEVNDLVKRKGWHIYLTKHPFAELVKRLEAAVAKNKMAVVNAASASDGAKAQGFTIPGNRVVGVFRNDFARRMLATSIAAGIEAPVRFYVTENSNGMSTLAYRAPSAVFAPYVTRRTRDLADMAKELDAVFARIALDTIGE